MSSEVVFDPYTELYSGASSLLRSSEIRDLMSVTGRRDIISFAGGLPFFGGLPEEEIADVMHSVLRDGMDVALQYCETEGRSALKSHLVGLMDAEGIRAEPEHILITTGSQQALDLIARTFIDPGDTIVIEGPTYVGALSAFRPANPDIITVPLDELGMRVGLLEETLDREAENRQVKFLYVVPSFNNPAGVTMSESRRAKLLEIARRRDILLVEDNPYGLLRFEGKHLEPLAARDNQRVVYLGTLSKIVSPGIRTGWVLAPAPVIDRLTRLKQSADLCSSTLSQMFAEEYLRRGLWKKNVDNLKPIYRSRRDAMLSSMEKRFPPEATWTRPQGGLFIWVELPSYLDTAKMLPLAIEQKVAFVPGTAFFADGSGTNQMRLNFSYPDEDQISEGIRRLGKVIRREMELYHSLGLDSS